MTYDVIVVGLGGMGSAIAGECAARGLRVLGIERFSPIHTNGSSHGKARQIRETYAHGAYIPLIRRSFELWRELAQTTSEPVLTVAGAFHIGAPNTASIAAVRASAIEHGIALQELDAATLRRRYPTVRIRPGETVFFEPGAGMIVPEHAIKAQLARAVRHAAELRFGVEVQRIAPQVAGISELELRDGTRLRTRHVALCVGPWLPNGLAGAQIRVQARRVVQAWFRPSIDAYAVARFSGFNVERPELPGILYGFPDTGDGVKAAFHTPGAAVEPDHCDRSVSRAETDEIAAALDDVLPGAAAQLTAASTCLYTMTPDEHFSIGPLAHLPGVIVAGGFSGHGFKFCPVVGEIVADLCQSGASRHDISLFSPHRFNERITA